ncbi:hypothetical protein GCM10011581_42640 [Saccharopolyspora subtropica]|uniref:PPE family protein n=1 Tax=Saccharopolyspora thermophila TaxID=89367 RepID=A0A917K5M3_9PSEU|nr:hypothetical protein GCM10011581_42640 [Saccharopolyspora subtropica]
MRGTGLKIQEAGVAAAQTKSSLQPPAEYDSLRTGMASIIGPAGTMMDVTAQMREREEANKQARAIVQNIYTPGYTAVDGSTPTFPPPIDPLNPPPPPDRGRTTQDVSSTSTSGNTTSDTDRSRVGSLPDGPGSSSVDTPRVDGYQPPAQSSSQWASPPPSAPHPGGMPVSPGTQPPASAIGGVGAMPSGADAGPGAGARGAAGIGAGNRGATGMGAGGRSAAGLGAGGRAGGLGAGALGAGGRSGVGGLKAGPGAVGAAGAAGARGGAGAGAMGAGAGQRGQGSEDREHERPSWLEEQEDVWLDGMPRTAPPVFGDFTD